MAEFLRRGRPLGLAKAPSSRARSCRMGWTRMTWPSRDSCTRPGHDRDVDGLAGPAAPGRIRGPCEADHSGGVGELGDRQPGGGVPCPAGYRGPRQPVRLIVAHPLGVGGDHHPGVQDIHQAAGHDDLDRLAGVGSADVVREPGQGDLAVRVHPPRHPRRAAVLCRPRSRWRGLRRRGGVIGGDGPVREPEPLHGPGGRRRTGGAGWCFTRSPTGPGPPAAPPRWRTACRSA